MGRVFSMWLTIEDEMNSAAADSARAPPLRLASRIIGLGPPRMLLIHGLGDGGFLWEPFIACFPKDIGAMTVDLRGHGDSPWDPLERYERAALAADVLTVFDAVPTQGVVVIGHSLGAEVAIEVAAKRPDAVDGLVIVDGGPEVEHRGAQILQHHMQAQASRFGSVMELETLLAERHPLADAESLRHYARSAIRETAEGCFELKFDPAVMHSLQPHDAARVWDLLGAVRCPVLLIRGAMSAMLSQRIAVNVSERLPDCELAVVPRAGHSVVLETPRGLHAAVEPFLRRVQFAGGSTM